MTIWLSDQSDINAHLVVYIAAHIFHQIIFICHPNPVFIITSMDCLIDSRFYIFLLRAYLWFFFSVDEEIISSQLTIVFFQKQTVLSRCVIIFLQYKNSEISSTFTLIFSKYLNHKIISCSICKSTTIIAD